MRREAVLRALKFKKAEPVPHYFRFTLGAEAKVREYYGSDYPDCLNNYMHMGAVEPEDAWQWIEKDIIRDEWGVEWDRSVDKDIGLPRNRIFPEPDMKYWNPPPVDAGRFAALAAEMKSQEDVFFIAGMGFSLYERAWTLRGMVELLTDFITNPDFVHELMNAIADWNVQIVKEVVKMPGVDAVHFGDDWGAQNALIMGPEMWHKFIGPQVKKMYGAIKDGGKYCSQHSCGRVQELFPDLVNMGLNIFNPFQPEVMDVHEMHSEYFDRLAFWGGLSVQETLPHGTPEDVRKEVVNLYEMGARGGYILAPSHDIPSDAPLENLAAMIETVRELER